jgi:hypothetical protein
VAEELDRWLSKSFPHAGPLKVEPWPLSLTAARYVLVYGGLPIEGNPPTWGLVTIDGVDVVGTIYPRPFEVTRNELIAWLEPTAGPEAASALVGAMFHGHRHLFADPADPSEGAEPEP